MAEASPRSSLLKLVLPALFVAALLAFYLFSRPKADASDLQTWAFSGVVMGTTYSVKVVATSGEGQPQAGQAVRDALAAVDARMSTYKPDSELSQVNRQGTAPLTLSPELAFVLAEALRVHQLSGGVFDVTVKPLVDAWGFGPPGKPVVPPSEEQVATLRAFVGSDKLQFDAKTRVLTKTTPQVQVDLSAIAKGYGVDQAGLALEALGHHRYMVEVGGEVRARGQNAKGEPWQIGVEQPDVEGHSVQRVLPLKDLSVATSGDYRNYYEQDGVRLSHTIDPRTGKPITHRLASVSVLHESCTTADAWATALNVLGPDEGLALAEREGLPVYLLVRTAQGAFEARESSAFKRWTEHR